jgi:hypothetical protein
MCVRGKLSLAAPAGSWLSGTEFDMSAFRCFAYLNVMIA